MQEPVLPDSTTVSEIQGGRLAWGLPPLSTNLVLRPRIFAKLNAAGLGGMTLVSGPPGSGKSALVSGWARYTDPGEVLWLSLTPDDNRAPDLWTRVRTELSGFTGGELSPDHPIILVIDNIEVIARPDLSRGLASMVEGLAGRVGVILIGRHTGHLPLHRLGMHMSLTELGPEDLPVTEDETAALLTSWRSEEVPLEWAKEVSERSEGWAGGIRLACLMMSDLGPCVEVGDCLRTDWGLIADYFQKEVFEQQPPDVQDFLCRTAVLDDLDPEVCQAVSGRQDALHLLEDLTRQNLFVRRGPETASFRYHGLFRDFLRHQLALNGTDAEAEVRISAARCLENRGETEAAMAQLIAARAYDQLFSIALKGTLSAVEAGRPVEPRVMLPGGLPDSYFDRSPLRMYPLCVSYLARLQLEKAASWLRRMELSVDPSSPGAAALAARCEFLWAVYDLARMNPEGMMRHLESSRGWMEADQLADFYGSLRGGYHWMRELDSGIGSIAPVMEAQGELWRGRPGKAGQILTDAYGLDRAATDPMVAAVFSAALNAEGQISQAHDLAAAAMAQAADAGLSESTATVGIRLALAQAMYERDDLAGAEEQLSRAEEICRSVGQERWRAGIECERARLDMARGRLNEALRRLGTLKGSDSLSSTVPLRQSAYETEIRCRLSLGDLLGAEDLLIESDDVTPSPELLARFHLATGRPDRAAAEIGRSGFTARGRPSVERLLLQTRVFLQAGNRRAAEHALQRSVNLARGDELIRVFLDEPKQITDLLTSVSAGGTDTFVQRILMRAASEHPPAPAPQPFILEPLTERERELLGYLPCHLSQSEIASRMFISANTVKTHMKGLYRKLGASSRSEAVDIARDCGLLSPTIGV